MLLLIYLFMLEPMEIIDLPMEFSSVAVYNGVIYLAQYFGKSIYRYDSGGVEPLQFSELDDYRIRNFRLTPFAVYINDGRKIEKLYLASGVRETVYEASDISGFAITAAEEVIVADRGKNEVVFLDTKKAVRLKKENINVIDVEFSGDQVYCLTDREVLLLDEFSNVTDAIKLKARYEQVVIDSGVIYLFSPGMHALYRTDADLPAVEITEQITGVAFGSGSMILLSGNGTVLYIYNKPAF